MLKIALDQLFAKSRYLAAVVAGIVLAASFPKIGVAGLAWIAPALMLFAALGKRGAEAFRIGYVAGLAHYLTSLYWLLNIPYTWHSIPLGPATGWLALGAFMASFPATWVWFMLRLTETTTAKPAAADANPGQQPLFPIPENFLTGTWLQRLLWALTGACLWVAMEMFVTRIFGGFPWNLLGTSQYKLVPLIQIASVTAVYGVSFLVVWFSLSLASAGLLLIRNPGKRQVLILEIFLPVLVIAGLFSFGLRQVQQAPAETRTCKVALIQPSIPQTLIWDDSKDDERFEELLRITETAVTNSPNLVIWPEAAVPKLLRYDREVFEKITGIAQRHKLWMILGADDAEPKKSNPKEADYFNSSFLVSPEGKLVDHYKKRALVIFGEYLPLTGWLPFLKWFTPIQGGFTPGDQPSQFHMPDLGLNASVLICYEDIFPQIGRGSAKPDTDFLVNITNDGWFGEGAAQWQQGMSGLFRAVENRIPLIRCTNNGLTCWIDGYGRVRQIFRDSENSVYGKGYLLFELPLPERATEQTFYTRHGDVFGWLCVAVSIVVVLTNFGIRHRTTSRKESVPPEAALP